MRSISGFEKRDSMRISKNLKPDASNVAICLASQTDVHVLALRNSLEKAILFQDSVPNLILDFYCHSQDYRL